MCTISVVQPSLFERETPKVEHHGRTEVRILDHAQVLTRPTGRLAMFDYSLNPYVGCGFSCTYCYASFFQPDQERFDNWGKWVDVKRNAVDAVSRARNLKGKLMIMSSATDPYQPIEAVMQITRGVVEVLSEPDRQPDFVVQTRGPLVARDIDLFKRFESIVVNMSITTDSEEVRKAFEPSCASLEKRMEALTQVKQAGLKTCFCISPMLPIENPKRFAKLIKETGADRVGRNFFIFSDRQFASNTRPEAIALMKHFGWDEAAYRKTWAELSRELSALGVREREWSRGKTKN